MKAVAAFAAAFGLASAATVQKRADASTPITISGNAFMRGNDRFYVRGVDYQPGGSSGTSGSDGPNDPLRDEAFDACSRDIKNFVDLGLNTIRVYTIDNSAKHDKCMDALKQAGIYLILDVNSPHYSLNRENPAKSYNPSYLQSIFATIDVFQKYDNTMAFFSGNEVINETKASTLTAPYIKAVTRDMKQYLGNRQYRSIPVGYSAADIEQTRYDTASFLNCGTPDERSDFFAFNDYSWCDPSDFQKSGWADKVQKFKDYSIPIFLSEYGCNKGKRAFEEVKSLYGTDMSAVYSGGLVYEYSNEANSFGLGSIDGTTYTPNDDYKALKDALAGTPLPSGDGGFRKSGQASQCPVENGDWQWGNDSLPAIPDGAKKYMTGGAGKAGGLTGSSQDAPGGSTTWATPGSGAPSTTAKAGTSSGGSSTSKSAGPLNIPEPNVTPFIIGGIWLMVSMLGGASVLL